MNEWFLEHCPLPDEDMAQTAQQRQRQLTKPPGSLGCLEQVAVTLSAMQSRIAPTVDEVEIAVFAGDHGVANEGVSAFPQVVTGEMVKNFVRGGAAISVLAQQIGAGLTVINAGTISEQRFAAPVVDQPIARGTENIVKQAAMTAQQCVAALALGKSIVDEYTDDIDLVIGGEMGIGNTTSATALAAAFGVATAAELVGPGTGLDEQGVAQKLAIIEKALSRLSQAQQSQALAQGVTKESAHAQQSLALLAELGGFEIVALVGFYIAAAQRGMPILVDGFISTSAAFIACQLNSTVRQWMLFAHSSAEPGHQLLLQTLSAQPLLSLGMRLGEGSGAAVAVNILRTACALHNGMATFEEAGVSEG